MNILPDKKYGQVILIRPTGWTFDKSKKSPQLKSIPIAHDTLKPTFSQFKYTNRANQPRRIQRVYVEIPYSEHSSFAELEMFLKGLSEWPRFVVPTVNIYNQKLKEKMDGWLNQWKAERKDSGRVKVC